MSWTCVGPDLQVKGRKEHRCDVCGGGIAPGEIHWTRTGVEAGEGFYTMHMHGQPKRPSQYESNCYERQKTWTQDDWE